MFLIIKQIINFLLIIDFFNLFKESILELKVIVILGTRKSVQQKNSYKILRIIFPFGYFKPVLISRTSLLCAIFLCNH